MEKHFLSILNPKTQRNFVGFGKKIVKTMVIKFFIQRNVYNFITVVDIQHKSPKGFLDRQLGALI